MILLLLALPSPIVFDLPLSHQFTILRAIAPEWYTPLACSNSQTPGCGSELSE
jgi:hypothetical protein